MKKASPIWQEIPIHFKKEVVTYLDFQSRRSLQLCSTQDQELVLNTPIFLNRVSFYPPDTIRIDEVPYRASQNELIEMFIRIFHHQKTFVEYVDFICGGYGRQEIMNSFLQSFLDRLKTESQFKINSERFYFDAPREVPLGESFFKILKLFDAKKLRSISIAPKISSEILDEVVNSDQWKNSTSLQSFGVWEHDTDLQPFLRFERLNIQHFDYWKTETAWEVIENFLNRNLPLHSSFQVIAFAKLNMTLLLGLFTVQPFNQPLEQNNNYYKHTQLFELPDRNNMFVLKITNTGIFGAVCRKTHLEADFRWGVFRILMQ